MLVGSSKFENKVVVDLVSIGISPDQLAPTACPVLEARIAVKPESVRNPFEDWPGDVLLVPVTHNLAKFVTCRATLHVSSHHDTNRSPPFGTVVM